MLNNLTKELKQKKLTIATAESATGGLIANTLTNISGSSDYFERGLVTYTNKAKVELLDVSELNLKKYGAVSSIVAKQMAKGARINSDVDIAISTTGIAGPTGGTKDKPVGTVFIGFSSKKITTAKKFHFDGNRLENKEMFCNAAIKLAYENIR
jgi:nicotinamide-nucleotide amidase